MKFTKTLTAIAFALSLPAQADQVSFNFTNTNGSFGDTNWFNPANWSTGRVPGPEDDVLLDENDYVVIDPALGPMPVKIRDLRVSDRAKLTTLPGTIMQTRDELVSGNGRIDYHSSGADGESLTFAPASDTNPCVGNSDVSFNPTAKSIRTVDLQSSVVLEFGLGGREPATLTKESTGTLVLTGSNGHYATLTADIVVLGGDDPVALARGGAERVRQATYAAIPSAVRDTLPIALLPVFSLKLSLL